MMKKGRVSTNIEDRRPAQKTMEYERAVSKKRIQSAMSDKINASKKKNFGISATPPTPRPKKDKQ